MERRKDGGRKAEKDCAENNLPLMAHLFFSLIFQVNLLALDPDEQS